MRTAAGSAIVLAAGALLAVRLASADPPALIQYQGILLTPDGRPRPGPVDLELALFDAPLGGDPLYRESHPDVPLLDGVFAIPLGGGQERAPEALSAGLFTGPGTRWLEVRVEGEVLVPRQQLLSVPYAFEAASALSLQGQTLAQLLSAAGRISGYEQVGASAVATSLEASCPAGKVVVGGGCDCFAGTTESRPVGGHNSWHCECSTRDANRAWVLCATSGAGVCGNGVRDPGELCDSASAAECADGRCAEGCVCACGNGRLEAPEQCDGPAPSACPGNACGADCRCACGNGILDAGELCDGVAGVCSAGSGCRADCACSTCGDGVLDAGEQCDGSAANTCSNGVCGSDCRCSCGNGALDPGEPCDGSATELCPANSTGCSPACACIRCGDGLCAPPETAASCPADCTGAYRPCTLDRDCDAGLYCEGVCTDSCFRTCDLDPAYDEICSSASGIGHCVPLCRLDPETSSYVCPAGLVCPDRATGGVCRLPAL